MLVAGANAQRIVEEMEDVVHKHINLMNAQGYIIASTDPTRIGQFHGGAMRVITEKLEELVIPDDHTYQGSRKGINLPIVFHGEIIGVIGITGERDEVVKYGQIIKRMTEILVLESYLKDQNALENRTRNYFIEEWIFGASHEYDPTFEVRGRLLGLDIQKPRIVAVMYLSGSGVEQSEIDQQRMREKIFRQMREEIDYNKDNIVISIGPKYIFLFCAKSPATVKERIQTIKQKLEAAYPVKVSAGVGNLRTNHNEVSFSYQEAEKALKVSSSSADGAICVYEDINVELFIEEIPHRAKKEFVKKIFRTCTDRERKEWLEILDVFFRHNGSINKAAEELYIHKNTLQYRINKLIKKTGFDPRVTRDGLLLYLALLISKSEDV